LALTLEQKALIQTMNVNAKEILKQGGQEALLISLCDKMSAIKGIMDASSKAELNQYCQQYEGFYHYMKLLEQLAKGCSEGVFNDLLY
jgi:hypothetical protein